MALRNCLAKLELIMATRNVVLIPHQGQVIQDLATMKNQAPCYVLLTALLSTLSQPVLASSWQVCSMELRVTDTVTKPYPQLRAKILKVSAKTATVICPERGATIMFTPETSDYQAVLPRRTWPQKGQVVGVDYRYLDGICKGDGKDYPCRIKHYSLPRH
jgi:hypothetical protein